MANTQVKNIFRNVSLQKTSSLRLFATSNSSLSDVTKLRSNPPIYFDKSNSYFSLVKPSSTVIPLGTTRIPFKSFIKTIPHEDTDSLGQSSGEAGFTSFELYPIPPPADFVDNTLFITSVLFPTLEKYVHECPDYNRLAEGEKFYGGSTLHIYDFRATPPYGRIADVQDIIGTVRIQDAEYYEDGSPEKENGKFYKVPPIVPGSFEPNQMYRVLTMNGFVHLSELLQKKVAQVCRNA